jgi:ribosomal protein L20A (L18A)
MRWKGFQNGYILDVKDFRGEDKEQVLNTIYEMTGKRFKLTRHFIQMKIGIF